MSFLLTPLKLWRILKSHSCCDRSLFLLSRISLSILHIFPAFGLLSFFLLLFGGDHPPSYLENFTAIFGVLVLMLLQLVLLMLLLLMLLMVFAGAGGVAEVAVKTDSSRSTSPGFDIIGLRTVTFKGDFHQPVSVEGCLSICNREDQEDPEKGINFLASSSYFLNRWSFSNFSFSRLAHLLFIKVEYDCRISLNLFVSF